MIDGNAPLETTGATSGLRFKLERLIGRGSFGLVYRAVQLGLDRPVALKLLHPDVLENMEQVGRFLNEARVTASLTHAHIVQVIDHGVAGEQPWIAYEYLPGATLRALIPSTGFEWTQALEIGVQVAAALDEAHRQSIIHRDVKPENVMEAEPGHFKVTDFGLAKWNHRAAFRTASASSMGTPAYIAPELIATGKASTHTDQYALAVLIYEMLTGKIPFAGDTAAAIVERHLKATPVPPSSLKAAIPRGVDAVVLTALSKAPRDRHRTVAEFRDRLTACLDASAVLTPAAPASGSARNSILRQFWFHCSVAGAVAALLIAADPVGLRSRPAPVPLPAVASTPAPRPRPVSRLSEAEPTEIREQLVTILERHETHAGRTKTLAAALNPLFQRLADAAPEAAALEVEIRADQRMLTVLRERMLAYYPEPDLVPDAELTLMARVQLNAARGWCWLENMSNTRESIDAILAAHGDQTHDRPVLQEMEVRSYSAGGDAFVVESARAIKEALRRMEADPSLATPEVGDLLCELYWLASVVSFRAWPAEAQVRLREVGRSLNSTSSGPLAQAAATIWDLGSVKMDRVRQVREAAHRALARILAANLPHGKEIVRRVEGELSTAARLPTTSGAPSPARAPAPPSKNVR